jgi:hypothetical protein
MSDTRNQSIISRIAKNPLTYAFVVFGALVTEDIGLAYDNPYALRFACACAYYVSDEPLKNPACIKVMERLRHQR